MRINIKDEHGRTIEVEGDDNNEIELLINTALMVLGDDRTIAFDEEA